MNVDKYNPNNSFTFERFVKRLKDEETDPNGSKLYARAVARFKERGPRVLRCIVPGRHYLVFNPNFVSFGRPPACRAYRQAA